MEGSSVSLWWLKLAVGHPPQPADGMISSFSPNYRVSVVEFGGSGSNVGTWGDYAGRGRREVQR